MRCGHFTDCQKWIKASEEQVDTVIGVLNKDFTPGTPIVPLAHKHNFIVITIN